MKAIHLVGVGAVGEAPPAAAMEALAAALPRVFHVPCQVRREPLDAAAAFDAHRGQCYSTEILKGLVPMARPGTRLLGVTSLDLFVPIFTFVFGEAQLEGNCAVVSLHRLRERFYGLPERPELTRERLVKEAVHELGHTFGLRHCADWNCAMASSHGIELLDVKGAEFCASCRKVVAGGLARA